MRSRLLLFDIDGTLVDLRGVGLRALRRAAEHLHGVGCPELDLRGATDRGLAREILGAYGAEATESEVARFFEVYLSNLREGMDGADFDGEVLPGVPALLSGLRETGATMGLLTGNILAGAKAKMDRFGLAGFFGFGAYGDDHHDRSALGPIALRRAHEAHGRAFTPAETIVIGDTPKDIACGKALGAMTVCVATGSFGAEELRAAGADLVMESFADPAEVIAALRGFPVRSNDGREER